MDRGSVLHSYQYRESSLILQVWTEKHGRLGMVAKGARRPKSPSRAVLVAFQPRAMSWLGRGELGTLKSAEPAVPATPLNGHSLLSAFYLNELLLKLTHRDDPHEGLFDAYDTAITQLREISRGGRAARDVEPVLRRFELRMLQELRFALELARQSVTREPNLAERAYDSGVQRRPLAACAREAP